MELTSCWGRFLDQLWTQQSFSAPHPVLPCSSLRFSNLFEKKQKQNFSLSCFWGHSWHSIKYIPRKKRHHSIKIHTYNLEDKIQNAPLTSSELLLKLVLWRGEMSWPQREGQTTRGSPFDDWQTFLLFAAPQNSCCLCWPTPCQKFCQLQFWVWFLMPGSSCCWINEVPTIKILFPPPLGEVFIHGICSHYGWGEVRVGWGEAKNIYAVHPSSSCSQFLPNSAC